MTELLRFFIFVDRVEVFRLFVLTDMIGLLSLVKFTDMTELLRFFIFVDRVEVFRLFVLTDTIGLLSLVKFTDMTELLDFSYSWTESRFFRLFVFTFVVVSVKFADFVVLIISFDAIALSAKAAPTESTKSIENSIIPEISTFFIFSHLVDSNCLRIHSHSSTAIHINW